jgi:hypothetical protein
VKRQSVETDELIDNFDGDLARVRLFFIAPNREQVRKKYCNRKIAVIILRAKLIFLGILTRNREKKQNAI